MSAPGVETVELSAKPIEVSFPLPRAPETRVHIQLTIHETSLLLFLATVNGGDTSATAPLGSFVYALPDRYNAGQALSTPLCTYEATIDFTTRIAKALAKKTGKPVYIGNSMSFANAGMGGTVEEEIAAFKQVVEVVMASVRKRQGDDQTAVNGIDAH
ncbi:MAG: hypothetical protein M1818_006580 [Claussenomyces sp. TS43310]|nr:MAG: hypothetical protein M1818_006580 [Claussenomyces sp. TS43310]